MLIKIIITSIDNNKNFYLLKNLYDKAKYISVQNAMRTTKKDIFAELNELKKYKKKYRCDYIYVLSIKILENYISRFA